MENDNISQFPIEIQIDSHKKDVIFDLEDVNYLNYEA